MNFPTGQLRPSLPRATTKGWKWENSIPLPAQETLRPPNYTCNIPWVGIPPLVPVPENLGDPSARRELCPFLGCRAPPSQNPLLGAGTWFRSLVLGFGA